MNNNNHQYYKPFYLPSFTPIYPLESQGDTSTMFFEVKYRIKPSEFKSRLKGGTEFPPLTDIIAYNGKNIIPYWIDKSKYRLLEEKVEFEVCYNTITETYGYTPESKFTKKTITAWTRPAFDPQLDVTFEQLNVDSWTTNTETESGQEIKTHTLYFTTSVHRADVGDIIKIKSSNYNYMPSPTETILAYQQGEAFVKSVTADSITLSEFTFEIMDAKENYMISSCSSASELSAFNQSDVTFVCTFEIGNVSFGGGVGVLSGNGLYAFKLGKDGLGYDNEGKKIKLTIGDTIFLSNPGLRIQVGTSWREFYPWKTDAVQVMDIDDTHFYVEDFSVIYTTGASASYSNVDKETKGANVKRASISGRNAYQGDFVGTAEITYIREEDLQNLKQSWKAIKGRNYVDTISAGSNPNFDEYNNMILNNEQVLAQPQMAELFMGDIYKVTSVYIKVQ